MDVNEEPVVVEQTYDAPLEAVWQAIYDQYKPGSAEETIPRGRVGRLVATADRIDSLVGFFGLFEQPEPGFNIVTP